MDSRNSPLPATPAQARFADRAFFGEHRDRKVRIREPFGNEFQTEFRGFGAHEETRRRVIVWRLPAGMAKRHYIDFGRMAFLLFADETVEDRDDVLLAVLNEMMADAAKAWGLV